MKVTAEHYFAVRWNRGWVLLELCMPVELCDLRYCFGNRGTGEQLAQSNKYMDTFDAAKLCDQIVSHVPACSGWTFMNLDEQDFHADFHVRGEVIVKVCVFLHDDSFTGFIKTPGSFERITTNSAEFANRAVELLSRAS